MGAKLQKITPFLWFANEAEQAARFYVSVFPDARLGTVTHYDDAAAAVSGQPKGSVMTVGFELEGLEFVALNGGPMFRFNESISFVINCTTQEEIDHYWSRLGEGGDEAARQCGWLKDRFGVSWQVVPTVLNELVSGPDPERAHRAMQAMLRMKKLDIATLVRAAEGR